MSPASIRSLAVPGLAGTPKDKKYTSWPSKLELKGLVKPETASSTCSTLHLSRLNTFLFYFSTLKSCFNILSSDVSLSAGYSKTPLEEYYVECARKWHYF